MRRSLVLLVLLAVFATGASAQSLTATTVAGSPSNLPGWYDGTGSDARFSHPFSVTVDSSGNVYVADTWNHTIRMTTPAGVVTTLAGLAGTSGSTDGTGSVARFNRPGGVAVDNNDNIYVADALNHTIRRITPAGVVTTIAGLAGSAGSTDGTGIAARFDEPFGVVVDSSGNVYVADSRNHTIRMITPAGVVTTLAGLAGTFGSTNGTGNAARFYGPFGVALDNLGNICVADAYNHTIRKVTPAGVVTTFAGLPGFSGISNGSGSSARFNSPYGVTADSNGNLYVADASNHTIRMITPAAMVTTLAGYPGAYSGYYDGAGSNARFRHPSGIAVDTSGDLYVADSFNHSIRKVTPAAQWVVTTLAGVGGGNGEVDGTGSAARFQWPQSVAADSNGNVYVADTLNHTIRMITPAGVVSTFAGTAGVSGSTDGAGSVARFNRPIGVDVDSSGNVYVADTWNDTIRKITPAGVVTTLAGTAGSSGSTDGTGSAAQFTRPHDLAVDSNGNVFVADTINHTIRMITPAGVVSTFAGTAGVSGSSDGTGPAGRFMRPAGVGVDINDNVFVADTDNHTVRMITPAAVVTTLAGSAGSTGNTDDTGNAARFNLPTDVAVDSSGNVYVADTNNHTVRMITPAGVVSTPVGMAGSFSSTDGTGSVARFYELRAVTVDSNDNIFVADSRNHTIRKCVASIPDDASIDQATGYIGQVRQLETAALTASAWEWSVVRRPSGSTAPLSSTSVRNPTFTPDATGLYIFRLFAESASGATISYVSLDASVAPLLPELEVTRSGVGTINNGGTDIIAGTVDGVMSTATYDLENIGTAILTFGTPSVTATPGTGNPTVNLVGVPAGASTLAINGTTSFTLQVTPVGAGAWSVTVSINNDGSAGGAHSFTVSGTAAGVPALLVSRSGGGTINNGGADTLAGTVNGTMSTATYDLENVGSGTLTFGTPSVTATPGTGNPTVNLVGIPAGGSTLAINGTTDFTVQVTPNAIGPWTATLQIHSDGTTGGTHTFTLSGTAQAAPAPLIGVLRNGNPITNGGTDTLPANTLNLTYTIHNNGSLDLDLTGAPIVANSSEANCTVTLTQPGSATVAANGGTVTFTVVVTANSTGNFSFELSIPNSDATATPYQFTVEGSTTAPSSGGGSSGSGGSGCLVGIGTSPLLTILLAMLAAAATAPRRRRALAGR